MNAVIIIDEQGRITSANHAAERLFGYSCHAVGKATGRDARVFSADVPQAGDGPAAAPKAVPDECDAPPRQAKGTILVIDDEPLILYGLQCVIESWGYHVLVAADEADALDVLSSTHNRLSMIVADYRLRDGVTGAQVVQRIRKMMKAVIPAVIITGDTAPERMREAMTHDLEILYKPVQPAHLQQVIGRLAA